MKSLIKKIAKTKLAVITRNFLGIRPVVFKINNLSQNCSISDAFIWRTDNSFKTIFKYSDLLKYFYKIDNGQVEFLFFDKNYKLVKELQIENINLSNKLIIDKNFINKESYGIFYIFHKNEKDLPISIINKCYTGFSYKNSLESFVHGNIIASSKKFNNHNIIEKDIVATSYFKINRYRIQNFFQDFDVTELFFNNPSSKKINFSINKNNYSLESGCSNIIDVSDLNILDIYSNCYFLRPIIFNFKSDFIDVHHA